MAPCRNEPWAGQEAVHEAGLRRRRERVQDRPHRRQVRAMQAVAVDRAVRNYAYDDLLGTTEHRIEQLLAPLGRALLRVVEEAERPHLVVLQAAVVEENSSDDERACETAASRLIGAGDQSGAQLPIEAEELLAGAQRHGREDTRLLGRLCGVRGGNVGL